MATKKKSKKQSVDTSLAIEVEGKVYLVETKNGKEVERSEIDQNTVGLLIRNHVESAMKTLAQELRAAKKLTKTTDGYVYVSTGNNSYTPGDIIYPQWPTTEKKSVAKRMKEALKAIPKLSATKRKDLLAKAGVK